LTRDDEPGSRLISQSRRSYQSGRRDDEVAASYGATARAPHLSWSMIFSEKPASTHRVKPERMLLDPALAGDHLP
jgi:hypothetical protein